jgi:hypothetical protein
MDRNFRELPKFLVFSSRTESGPNYSVFAFSLHHNLLDCCNYLMMQSCLWQMVRTRANGDDVLDVPEGFAAHGHGQSPLGNAPSSPPRPSISLEQLLGTHNELMTLLIQNETRHGEEQLQHPQC